jgi:hypothetical protein
VSLGDPVPQFLATMITDEYGWNNTFAWVGHRY